MRLLATAVVVFGSLVSVALAASNNFVELPSSPETTGNAPQAVVAADLDGDGDPDLATANTGDNNVTVLRNNGAGNLAEPGSSPAPAGAAPLAAGVADLDGDTDRDLAVANLDSDDVTVLFNDGAASFTQAPTSPEGVGDAPRALVVADLDGDTDQDIATGNRDSDDVTILLNDGTGEFSEPASSPAPVGATPVGITAADLDGDTDQDLAVSNVAADNVTVLRNDGSGGFTEAPSSPEATGNGPRAVMAVNIDGDADQDLAVANAGGESLTVLRNNGSAGFTEPASSPEGTGHGPLSIGAADFDGDGDPDLAVTNHHSDDMTVLRNNGSGNFVEPASSPETVGDGATAIAPADLDGDGDPDLAIANHFEDSVTILRNR